MLNSLLPMFTLFTPFRQHKYGFKLTLLYCLLCIPRWTDQMFCDRTPTLADDTKLEAIGNKKLKWGCTDWCTLRKFLWETLVSLPKVNVPQLRLIIISSSPLTAKYKRSISISMAWYRYNNLNINLTKQTNSFKINIVICGVKKENVWYCKAGQCSHSGNCNIQSLASSTMVMLILICECQHRNQSVRIDSILISWLVEQDVTRWQTNKKLTSLL